MRRCTPIRVCLWTSLFALAPTAAPLSQGQSLDGVWEISMIVVNGRVLDANETRQTYAADGRLSISGNTISLLSPQNLQLQQHPIVIDASKKPATIDVALTGGHGGHGVILANGDAAVICLASPNQPRTTAFASPPGSGNLLVSLTRAGAGPAAPIPAAPVPAPAIAAPAAAPAVAIPAPVALPAAAPPPMTYTDDQLRAMLTGTWGHRDNDTTRMMTFNADGTMSAQKTWKEGLANIFHTDTRSSGAWKVQNGVVIVQITASTDKAMHGQIYSYRIRSINDKELLAVDPNGQLRQEWKAPTP